MLPFYPLVKTFPNEIIEYHAYVLAGKLSVRSHVIIQEDSSNQIALHLRRLTAYDCWSRHENTNSPGMNGSNLMSPNTFTYELNPSVSLWLIV